MTFVAYALTGSTTTAGLIGTVMGLTMILVGVVGGAIVDRMDRRRAMILYGAISGALWMVAGFLLLTGHMTYPVLLLICAGSSVTGGLFGQATNAALRSIVPVSQFAQAQANNQGRDGAISILGSPLGGFLYVLRDWLPFFVPALCYFILVGAALMIRTDLRPHPNQTNHANLTNHADAAPKAASLGADIKAGFAFLGQHGVLRQIFIAALVINLGFTGISTGMNLYLVAGGISSVHLGMIQAATGVVSILGAVVAGKLVNKIKTGQLLIVTMGCMALFMLPLVFSQTALTYLICMCLAMALIPAVNSGLVGFIMGIVPAEMQGRVNAIFGLMNLTNTLTGIICGWLLENAAPWVCMAIFWPLLALSVLIAISSRQVREIPLPDEWQGYIERL
ncbi:putative permease [Actinobaculum suis]|uniref:Putative permease n=2 Tax=Actinobaculum suis TaxID=1657 RepID=A0A7Z8YA36_9ACTO|nr:putative permease [Actinobaculum suis]